MKKVRKNAVPELLSKLTKFIAIYRATQTMKNGMSVLFFFFLFQFSFN